MPMARLALSWVVRRPNVTSILIGARNIEQVDQAFDALAAPWNDAIAAELDQLSAIADMGP
jgi:L-glyceraldehyde 3-phosphate reductase